MDSVNNHLFAFMNKLPFLTIVLCYLFFFLCGVSCKTRLGLERTVGWLLLTDVIIVLVLANFLKCAAEHISLPSFF